MRRFLTVVVALTILSVSAMGGDGFVTARFAPKAADNNLRFDLSALPTGAKVQRAVLQVPETGHQSGVSVKLAPELDSAKPLELLAPEFNSFDATAAVQAWAAKPESNKGLKIVSAGGVNFDSAVLLVSYAGKVDQPLPVVKELKVQHIAGQTFLTWQEVDEPVGEDQPTYEKFEKAILDAREKKNLSYRVYSSDKPITLDSIGQAQLVCEAPGYVSGWNIRVPVVTRAAKDAKTMASRLWPGAHILPEATVPRYRMGPEAQPGTSADKIVPPEQTSRQKPPPLPRSLALAVISPRQAGKSYYAVTACVDGREAVAALDAGNSLAQPVDEKPCAFPVGMYQRTNTGRTSTNEIYNTWFAEPFNNTSAQAELAILRWNGEKYGDEKNPVPVWLFTNTYSGGTTADLGEEMYAARRYIKGVLTLSITEPGVWQGWHECIGTLKGFDQGFVSPYPQRRAVAAAKWAIARPELFADPERIYIRSQFGVWALRHGDVFAAVMSNGYGNMSLGNLVQKYGHLWGPYPKACKTADGVDYWDYMNYAKWVRENPAVELPYWVCAESYGMYPSHTVGDFGFMPWPEMIHAMLSTKRAFCATWNTNGPGLTGGLYELIPQIKMHQSLPAFTRCNRDANPGDGDWADSEKTGAINVYQMWEPQAVVDEPAKWEITLYARKDCPGGELTTDVTPRRCQKFTPSPANKAKEGDKFNWRLTALESGKVLQQGMATADKFGLVTVEQIKLTQDKARLSVWK